MISPFPLEDKIPNYRDILVEIPSEMQGKQGWNNILYCLYYNY